MARNDLRPLNSDFGQRAHLRADADGWRSLASAAVATTLVVALVVCALALMEAAVSTPASQVAQRFPSRMESQRWHASAQRALDLEFLRTA